MSLIILRYELKNRLVISLLTDQVQGQVLFLHKARRLVLSVFPQDMAKGTIHDSVEALGLGLRELKGLELAPEWFYLDLVAVDGHSQ